MRNECRAAHAAVAAGLLVALGAVAPDAAGASAATPLPTLCGVAYAQEPSLVAAEAGDTVYVDADAANPSQGVYGTLDAALQALPAGGAIELRSNVAMNTATWMIGKDVELDLAGHTIEFTSPGMIQVGSEAHLTVDGGGSITSTHAHVIVVLGALTVGDATLEAVGPTVYLSTDASELVVTGGRIVSTDAGSSAIHAYAGSVKVSGGLFSSPVRPSWCASGYAPRVSSRGDPNTLYTVGVAVGRPTAVNRTYDGTEQFGADASDGYALTGGGTEPGTYATTATPNDGYAWSVAAEDAGATDTNQLKALSEAGATPVSLSWTMGRRQLDPSMATAPGQTYDGSPKTPVVVAHNGKTLAEGTDYTIAYAKNVNAGEASFTVSGKGNYVGDVEGTFAIVPANIARASFASIPKQTYTGKPITPQVSGTFGERELEEGTDFTAEYADNTDVGTATVSITGIGNYAGTQKLTFAIEQPEQTPAEEDDSSKGDDSSQGSDTSQGSTSGSSSKSTPTVASSTAGQMSTSLARTGDPTNTSPLLAAILGAAALAAAKLRRAKGE